MIYGVSEVDPMYRDKNTITVLEVCGREFLMSEAYEEHFKE
ncbi:MAG: hypothetical protein WAJ93_12925 [Candidatus Nitrosopolaris sp.]